MPESVHSFLRCGQWHDIETEDDATVFMQYPNAFSGPFYALAIVLDPEKRSYYNTTSWVLHANPGEERCLGMRRSSLHVFSALLCLCLLLASAFPLQAHADVPISKVLTTTKFTPVALMELQYVPAATSTEGVYIVDYAWYDANTGAKVVDQFGVNRVEVQITLATHDGYEFADEVNAYLNNVPADCIISPDRHYLTILRTYNPEIWLPSVVKQPTDEFIEEWGMASFAANANYTLAYEWFAVNPETGAEYTTAQLSTEYGVIFILDAGSTMTMVNVPASLDGWQFYCSFIGALDVRSNSRRATLHVKRNSPVIDEYAIEPGSVEAATPSPEPTPEPTPSPTPTPVPTASPEPSPEHFHVFPSTWHYDDAMHWRACECGEMIEQGAHVFTWKTLVRPTRVRNGTEQGVCDVCGYTTTREAVFQGLSPFVRVTLTGVVGLAALTVLVLLIDTARQNAAGKHKK